MGFADLFAVEEGVAGSVARALVEETAEKIPTVIPTLCYLAGAAPAPRSAVDLVFASALVAVVVTAGETAAVPVPAAAEIVLGKLDVVLAVAVLPVESAVPAVAAELPVPVAVVAVGQV